MSFRTVQRRLLTDTVYRKPYTSRDAYGDPSYGSQVTIGAYIVYNQGEVITPDGNTVAVTHSVYSDSAIYWQDVLWLPGDDQTDDTEGRPVMSVTSSIAEDNSMTLYEARL